MIRVVRIEDEALAEAGEAMRWYEESRPGRAWAFMQELHRTIALLEKHPAIGTPVERQVRRQLIDGFPYWLYYRIEDDVLRIFACYHGKRDQSRVMERIQ